MEIPKEHFQDIATSVTNAFLQSHSSLFAVGQSNDSVYQRFAHEIQIYNGLPRDREALAELVRQRIDSSAEKKERINFLPCHVTIYLKGELVVGRYLIDVDYFAKCHSNVRGY